MYVTCMRKSILYNILHAFSFFLCYVCITYVINYVCYINITCMGKSVPYKILHAFPFTYLMYYVCIHVVCYIYVTCKRRYFPQRVALHRKFARALTFENFWQAPGKGHSEGRALVLHDRHELITQVCVIWNILHSAAVIARKTSSSKAQSVNASCKL